MLNFFSRKKQLKCPLDQATRLWMENAFLFLATQFGHDHVRQKKILIPSFEIFPNDFDGSKESLYTVGKIVAEQMEVDFSQIDFHIYNEGTREIDAGNIFGTQLFIQFEKGEHTTAGQFLKDSNGKYNIFIEVSSLTDLEVAIAVLAHEFSHIKLLGENRVEINDEALTDLLTVVLGVGIFNANSCFKERKTEQFYQYKTIGYLTQQEWGYALALFAHFREEKEPNWLRYLSKNLLSDFKKSQAFIFDNNQKIFREDNDGNYVG